VVHFPRWLRPAGLFLVLLAVGCDGGAKTAKVSGKVTYNGKPIASGQVTFEGEGGKTGAGPIADGTYAISDAPVGPVRIGVVSIKRGPKAVNPSEVASGTSSPSPAPAAAKFVPVPERFGIPAKSGLTYTVTAGSQTYDIDIKP
jgi:hypothetical protein